MSRCALEEVPCKTNPLGVKGIGESGTIGAPPAVINAMIDALRAARRRPHRHAGDADPRVGGDPAREGQERGGAGGSLLGRVADRVARESSRRNLLCSARSMNNGSEQNLERMQPLAR